MELCAIKTSSSGPAQRIVGLNQYAAGKYMIRERKPTDVGIDYFNEEANLKRDQDNWGGRNNLDSTSRIIKVS